jgi:transcriptional regulator with XRE-family HTH domain
MASLKLRYGRVMVRVGEHIKRLREERDWSQPRLAVEAGVAVSAVSQIENGKRSPNVSTLDKLADAFGVEVADFFPKAQRRSSLELSFGDLEEERPNLSLWTRLLDLKADRWEKELKNYEASPPRKRARSTFKDPYDHGRALEISQDVFELTGFLSDVVSGLNAELMSPDVRKEGLALLAALDRASTAADELGRLATPTPDDVLELSQERHDEWRKQREVAEQRHEEIRRLTREIA